MEQYAENLQILKMRKILFLLACTLLVGCCTPGEIPDPITIGEKPVRHYVRPYYIEFDGHRYIYFSGSNGGSMVHHPDCCKEVFKKGYDSKACGEVTCYGHGFDSRQVHLK